MATLLHRLERWARTEPEAPAQRFKENGSWRTLTAREYRDRVYHLALYFKSIGLGPGKGGAIYSYNRPEWVQMELALTLVGARSAGIYPNAVAKDIHYILEHTEAQVLGVQNEEYFHKAGELPVNIQQIIVFEGSELIANSIAFEEVLKKGAALAKEGKDTWDSLLSKVDPDAGLFLIYTSGTTGTPKGAMISHANLVFAGDEVVRHWKLPSAPQTMFSFLPLCHIAEKLQNLSVGLSQRYTIYFATKFDAVGVELTEVQPTILLCVPRLWEKMVEGVESKLKAAPKARRKLARWALDTGSRIVDAKLAKKFPRPADLVQWELARKLVIKKLRQALGLLNCRWAASGAAPLPAHVAKWFRSLGLEILEDYGQTESTGILLMTQPGVESSGAVGVPPLGIDFKLGPDEEILTRGRHVFQGYFKNEKATQETIVDGWLHTGDLGEMDQRGLIRIKGRKKEIMKTSGGKMIAPLPIEERIKEHSLIGQACLVGDNRKYLSVLITLSEGALSQARARPSSIEGEVVRDGEILGAIKAHLDSINKDLSSYEQVKRFTVVAREFSIEKEEMTPTLKMKRAVVERNFSAVIEQMYESARE
jgi:long-chain acyl-CoA synthetase